MIPFAERHARPARGSQHWTTVLGGPLALLLVTAIYWPSLAGPFIFDDIPNLAPVHAWWHEGLSLYETIFGNGSGPLGRPLAMLSFVLSEAAGNGQPFAHKLGNLLLHLINTTVVMALVYRLLNASRDTPIRSALPAAAIVATVWAIHPIQISTVAYVVQRMAELSALFTLLGILCFVHASATTDMRQRRLLLFLAIPALTVLAALGKENGLLTPAYCAAIHVGWTKRKSALTPSEAHVFFGAFLVVPAIAILAFLSFRPETFLDGFRLRDFTLTERLLTEPRILLSYLESYFLPQLTSSVVHMDDVSASTSLTHPITTTLSLLFWATLLIVGWLRRHSTPALLGGTLFFLAGHAMESSIFPLELAFEHRNYLASLAIPLVIATWFRESRIVENFWKDLRGAALTILAGCLLILAGLTFLRSNEWSSREQLVQRAVTVRPASLRARLDFAQLALEKGRADLAMPLFEQLQHDNNPRHRFVGSNYAVLTQCLAQQPVESDWAEQFANDIPTPLTLTELTVAEAFTNASTAGLCPTISAADLARAMSGAAANARKVQPASDLPIWRMQLLAAKNFERAGLSDQAIREADRAWGNSNGYAPAGILLCELLMSRGKQTEAKKLLDTLKRTIPAGQRDLRRRVEQLESSSARSSWNHQPNPDSITT